MSLPADEAHSAETPSVHVRAEGCQAYGGARNSFVEDNWQKSDDACVRLHSRPRKDLFTPLRVSASPPAKSLFSIRITEGTFCDSGERFRFIDAWTDRRTAHASILDRQHYFYTQVLFPVASTRYWNLAESLSAWLTDSRSKEGSGNVSVLHSSCRCSQWSVLL